MELLSYAVFALALSLDSFGAGLAYGTRKIKVPFPSLLIISLISMAAVSVSMLGGQILQAFVPPALVHRLGGVLLFLIGIWVLTQARQGEKQAEKKPLPENTAVRKLEIRIRPLGLVIQILKEPVRADLDSSGTISASEALVLGVALAMDALGSGFAVSLLGFSIGVTALVVGAGQLLLTGAGILAGRTVLAGKVGRRFTTLPGCILILLGLSKMH